MLHFKDSGLNCAENNITLTTSGGVPIETSANYVMNNNGMSLSMYCRDSTDGWFIF